ncbi:DNA polymerase III subunit gamma/tau [Salinisphaera sp.]|uniref:DNA polymerase III subunit gamma/tau n=1 Tax=Salinisphaera sp. TaxID=1914330 RepID=UPI000C43AA74|nr:DNA polymerase III subunit gamma/tau [Salinisphaera sp.]MAS08590.1 hypothetical protein [Salinisphaera sp.]|tara:strand:- start:8430 stop:10496 length:2067 start_codon:yes stop_codon:yes gene_type:complete
MSFQALARTWRPRRFDQLVGQEHVVRALTHALDNNKLHHALLFSGTRGVGKTTLARIIAKCLNCEHGVSASPCVGDEACATCREIDEGRYVDLIEVDAASRTGVDDTRELMDNVQYAPTRGRTKVYLIDEVHMLTKHSFNALLKTLEEPPPRVQFLLATTEPEKIPVTILSRCLQFPLKRLSAARIGQRLQHIVTAEDLSADDDALAEIARAADGSMRDGLSLLDQAVAFGGGALAVDNVRDMLGTIGDARVAELVDAVIDAQATKAMTALEALYAQGIDMRYLLDALATAWQHIATIQVVGEAIDDAGERWGNSAARLSPALSQIFYDITVAGARDYAFAPDPLVAVRMCVLRMLAFAPNEASPDAPQNETESKARDASSHGPVVASNTKSEVSQSPVSSRADSAREAMAEARAKLSGKPARAAETPAAPADREPTRETGDAESPDDSVENARTPSAEESSMPAASSNDDGAAQTSPPTGAFDVDTTSVESPPADAVASASDDAGDATDLVEPSETSEKKTNDVEDSDEFHNRVAEPIVADSERNGTDHPEDWHRLVETLSVSGFAAQLAHNALCRHWTDSVIELEIGRAHALMATDDTKQQLQAAIGTALEVDAAPKLTVHVVDALSDTPAKRKEADADQRQQDAVASIENDPMIRQLRDRLGAQLRTETIKPNHRRQATQQRDVP